MPTPAIERVDVPSRHSHLVGSLRTVGELGPAYQVLSITSETMATVVVLESEETLQYPIAKILADPET